jgi:hypothetical protein
MIPDLQTLRDLLTRLDPEADDFELQADQLVKGLKPEIAGAACQPFLEFFETHPLSYAGAPGTFVHHIETFYPSYVPALAQSVARRPSVNTILLVNRILNSSDCYPQTRDEFLQLLQTISTSQTYEQELVGLASRYLSRHT